MSGAGIGKLLATQQAHLLITGELALALGGASIAGAIGTTLPLGAPSPTGARATRRLSPHPWGSAFSARFSSSLGEV